LKKWLNLNNGFTALVVIMVIYLQLPTVMNNIKTEGKKIPSATYLNLVTGTEVIFPPKGSTALAVYWATWCGPCKIEMNRLRESVSKGKIPREKIFAINPFEDKKTVQNFLRESDYPFTFIDAPGVLTIEKTPTTLFIENEEITSVSTGLSLIGIWRAEALF
jgi:cytochrome c biogenesis protein CcmG, thiol:disulfide interchange protein DsbE